MKLLLCLALVLSPGVVAAAKEWRGIVPLHSTRDDVVRLLGRSKDKGRHYELETESVTIVYAKGNCRKDQGYKVPRGTVLQVIIYPKEKPRLADLNISGDKYQISHNALGIIYVAYDKSDGVGYQYDIKLDTVESVIYGPRDKDAHLSCNPYYRLFPR